MKDWKDIDERRKQIDRLSRAEMCRRAGISESTVTKGLQRGTRPLSSIRKQLDAVLAAAEAEQRGEAA